MKYTTVARGLVALGNAQRRFLGALLTAAGPAAARSLTAPAARLLYRLLPGLRERSEQQCSASLAGTVDHRIIPALAQHSFVHRIWNHVDLLLAERFLQPGKLEELGCRLPEPRLSELLSAQARRQPTIFVTAYYGPFDLLPPVLAFHGVRCGVVYRPHNNTNFDLARNRIRSRGGGELIPELGAARRVDQILGAGGSVALVADHPADSRGIGVTFLGVDTYAPRTVGLLAWRHRADVVAAGIQRVGKTYAFRLLVGDIIRHGDWLQEPDTVDYVTRRYVRALEAIILSDPSQYPWGYARWG